VKYRVVDWFKRQFPRKDLVTIGGRATLVKVDGLITTPNEWKSPITGFRAAAFLWRLVSRHTTTNPFAPGWSSREKEEFLEIAAIARGSDLVIKTETGTLFVAMEDATIIPVGSTYGVVSLSDPPPIPELVAPFQSSPYPVSIQEVTFRKGDRVFVRAYVEPFGKSANRGAYRTVEETKPEYRTRADLGLVEVAEPGATYWSRS